MMITAVELNLPAWDYLPVIVLSSKMRGVVAPLRLTDLSYLNLSDATGH